MNDRAKGMTAQMVADKWLDTVPAREQFPINRTETVGYRQEVYGEDRIRVAFVLGAEHEQAPGHTCRISVDYIKAALVNA